MRILVILGEGGHTVEMLRLLELVGQEPKYEYHYLLVKEETISERRIRYAGPIYYGNRPHWKDENPIIVAFKYLRLTLQSAWALWRVRPAASPRINALCNHCKSHWLVSAREAGDRIVYIGDGTTDRCPAGHADLLFAKSGLRRWCEERWIAHQPFESFHEIRAWFAGEAGRAWLDLSPT